MEGGVRWSGVEWSGVGMEWSGYVKGVWSGEGVGISNGGSGRDKIFGGIGSYDDGGGGDGGGDGTHDGNERWREEIITRQLE